MPQKRDDFVRLYTKMEMEKDTELVTELASIVLKKSEQIDLRVNTLPGINRTKQQQMLRIQQLIALNEQASTEVESLYLTAKQRRDSCRTFIMDHTCEALGIEEDQQ